jgi:hypothetical protein
VKACPDCAESVQDAARICRHCGFRFDRRGWTRERVVKWLSVAFAGLAIAGAAAWFFLLRDPFDEEAFQGLDAGDSRADVKAALGSPDRKTYPSASGGVPWAGLVGSDFQEVWKYETGEGTYVVAFGLEGQVERLEFPVVQ